MPSTPHRTTPAEIVTDCGERAAAAAPAMAAATDGQIATALRGMADLLLAKAPTLATANEADVAVALDAGTTTALVDRLRLGQDRVPRRGGPPRGPAPGAHPPRAPPLA